MQFTSAEKKFFEAVRQEDPSIDQMFKDIRATMEVFKGSKIKHLVVRSGEWGTPQPEGEPYVPLPRDLTIPNAVKHNQKLTASERRRANTRYK